MVNGTTLLSDLDYNGLDAFVVLPTGAPPAASARSRMNLGRHQGQRAASLPADPR